MECPAKIGEDKVLAWAQTSGSARPTGNTVHRFNGEVLDPVPCLAICEIENQGGYLLFYCDEQWEQCADTWHQTLDDAKAQAEFEYDGISSHWHQRESAADG
jgi:hypothetical protein